MKDSKFGTRYRLQQYIRGEWRDFAGADSRESLERVRKNMRFPDLFRVEDTEAGGHDAGD